MRRLFFITIYSLLINSGLLANPGNRIINLRKEAECAFNAGNFKQSKEQLYLLSSFLKSRSDSANLYKTWISISFLEYLMNRPSHVIASLRIAKQYQTLKDKYLNEVIFSARDLIIDASSRFLSNPGTINDTFFYNLRYIYHIEVIKHSRSDLIESEIDKLIKELSLRKDTLWFGYRNLLFEKGMFLYRGMNYKRSIDYLFRAIQISDKINSISYESLRSYKYIISALGNLGDEEQGTFYFKRFVLLYDKKLTDKKLLSEYYTIKGGYYYPHKMYLEANIAYELSIKYKQESGLDCNNEVYYLIGSYFYMGDFRKVIEWSQIYNGIKDSYYKLIVAYSYLKMGEIDLACRLEKEINKIDLIEQNKERPLILYWLSLFYTGVNDYKRAEQFLWLYLNQSIKKLTSAHPSIAQAYGSIAYFYWTVKGDIEKALTNYQRELSILLQEPYTPNYFDQPDISKSINNEALATCLRNKGEAFMELAKKQRTIKDKIKYLEAGLGHFDLAFRALNKYKFALLSEEKKLSYTNLTRHYYSYVIECCYQLYKISGNQKYAHKAFGYIEKSKASVLLSIMKGTEAKQLKMVPDWIINIEDNIKEHTNNYTKLIADENNKISPNNLLLDQYNDKIQELTNRQDRLLEEIKIKYPSYYNLKYGAEVTNLKELQQRLKKDQVMVQYAMAQTSIFVFLVSKDDYKFMKVPIDSIFLSDINNYRKAVSQFSYEDIKGASIYAFAGSAYRLFQTLLEPLSEQIKGKELIIIPDDVLNTIPFEALLTHKVEKGNDIAYKALPYLTISNPIIYNYSASLFVQSPVFNINKWNDPKLLALAPIHSSFKLSDINNITRDADEIVPIPGSIDEVKGIHKLFKGKIRLGEDATESQFKAICDEYQIIHIASHGFVNNEHPMFSKLVFNRDIQDTLNDGLLNTYEIYNMHISAPLVVLSACNTGSGKLYKGEGTISLARGFYAAGAKNIIMTLWAITDKTSNELVQHFYTQLAKSETVPVSLQQAKLEFIKRADEIAAHPFFWAGYISIGDTDVCFHDVNNSKYAYIWISGSAILLVLLIGIFRKGIRKKLQFFK